MKIIANVFNAPHRISPETEAAIGVAIAKHVKGMVAPAERKRMTLSEARAVKTAIRETAIASLRQRSATVADIARQADCDGQTVSEAFRVLSRRGLIQRERREGAQIVYALTDAGRSYSGALA